MEIAKLQEQVNERWTAQKGNPCHLSDQGHALVHLTKALGKIADVYNDAEHEQRVFRPGEVDKFLADLVICAARFGKDLDLEAACVARLAEKFPFRESVPAPAKWECPECGGPHPIEHCKESDGGAHKRQREDSSG